MRRVGVAAIVLAGACRYGFDPILHGDAAGDGAADVAGDAPADAAPAVCGARGVDLVPASGRVTGTYAALTDNAAGSCGGGEVDDAVFAIDVPPGGSLLVAADLPATTADTLIHVRRDCEDPATEVVCDRSGGIATRAAYRVIEPGAGRYYVFIDGDAGTAGVYEASIQVLLPEGAASDPAGGRERRGPELACTGGTCRPAGCTTVGTVPLAPGMAFAFTTTTGNRRNDHAGTCGEGNDGGVRGKELIVEITLTQPARLRASTDQPETSYDTLVYIRAGCAGAEIVCDDDGGTSGNRSVATTGTLAPGAYFVFVDAFAYHEGTVRVVIEAF